MQKEAAIREPLILGDKSYHQITEDVCGVIENKAPKMWYILVGIAGIIGLWGVGCILYLIGTGIGTWGLSKTAGWAWDITNFVWWVGIGHAGTLISAVLLLFRQKWRMAINRSAEAMTIFAVMMAAIFPGIHMGRIWVAYWVLPLPNQFGSLWVNFNSPLLWDVFAISTYFSVSLVFWYIGLIPDFATIRDRLTNSGKRKFYSILSFGWSGTAKNWNRFEVVSLVLAGLATPLVFSVHSIVSMDFATSVIPGWHTTIFPPYFVAGAVFSGFAMVQTLLLIMRKALKLEAYIHTKHVEYMNIVIIVTGSMVGVAYLTELFISWYSGVEYEQYAFINRFSGPYAWAYWCMMTCNVISPQLMWVRKWRRNLTFTFILSIIVNIGMWFERFVIIITSIHRDYLPSSWTMFYPTWVDIGVYIGTIGLFFVFFLLFSRFFPVLALNELKTILKTSGENFKSGFGYGQGYWDAHSHDHDHHEEDNNNNHAAEDNSGLFDNIVDKAKDTVGNIADKVEDVAEDIGDKISDIAENIGEKIEDGAEAIADKAEDIKDKVVDFVKGDDDNDVLDEFDDNVLSDLKSKFSERLGIASEENKDDLTKIKGIGPKIEKILNKIGVYTYEQVSKMTKEDYDFMDSSLKAFPGRAERDNWSEQAKDLINKKED